MWAAAGWKVGDDVSHHPQAAVIERTWQVADHQYHQALSADMIGRVEPVREWDYIPEWYKLHDTLWELRPYRASELDIVKCAFVAAYRQACEVATVGLDPARQAAEARMRELELVASEQGIPHLADMLFEPQAVAVQ